MLTLFDGFLGHIRENTMMIEWLLSSALGVLVGAFLHLIAEGFNAAYRTEPIAFSRSHFRLRRRELRWRLIFTMLFSGAGTALCMYHFGTGDLFFTALIFWYIILILTIIDLEHFLLPDIFTLPLIIIGLAQAALEIHIPLQESLIGAAAGFGSLWLVNYLFKKIRHKEGMGGGDFKLFAAIGAWVGWVLLPIVILMAALSGILFALLRNGTSKEAMAQPFPFGPMLGFAGFIALLYGQDLLHWYLSILSGG